MTRSTLKLQPKPVAAQAMAPPKAAQKNAGPPQADTRPGPPGPRISPPRTSPPRKAPRPQAAAPTLPDTGERLSKKVMQLKGCSRKEAEQYIEGGWVRVDGALVEEPQHRVDHQTVTLDPEASLMELTAVTLVVNKPAGHTDGLDEPGRKKAPPDARQLLTAAHHWSTDPSGQRVLKRHFQHLEADVELETGASGLVVFTQDWRTTRKLSEDMATMEHEYLVEVQGEVAPEALKPIGYALKDPRLTLPVVKVSVSSSTPEMSRLRFAVKGSHPGLIAYLCETAQLQMLGMKRVRLGRVSLADLPAGQWRYLAPWEKF